MDTVRLLAEATSLHPVSFCHVQNNNKNSLATSVCDTLVESSRRVDNLCSDLCWTSVTVCRHITSLYTERERERVQQIVEEKVAVSIDLKQSTAQLSNCAASDDSSSGNDGGETGFSTRTCLVVDILRRSDRHHSARVPKIE